MRETRVASRYAKSLITLAVEKKQLEQVYKDMQLVSKIASENKELQLLLKSPIVKTDKKKAILSKLFASSVSEITTAFINIIASKNREYLLVDISFAFVEQYKKLKGIITAELTTAIQLPEELKKKILNLVNPKNQSIEVVEKINKEIIGGFIVRVDDKQVDASVQRKIAELKQEFSKNPYVAEF
ncbi:MAG: ATP synthase F1 subunit delta [Bacteroidia bacterium]